MPAMKASAPPPIHAQRGSWRNTGMAGSVLQRMGGHHRQVADDVGAGRRREVEGGCRKVDVALPVGEADVGDGAELVLEHHALEACGVEAQIGVTELRILRLRGQAQPGKTITLALL